MSTILVAVIVIAVTVIPPFVFVRISKKQEKRRREAFLARFLNAGEKHGLSFSRCEELKDKILGLDPVSKMILLYSEDADANETLVDLTNVQACTVDKDYVTASPDSGKAAKAEQVLRRIALKIEFRNNHNDLLIAFYDHNLNGIYEIPELEQKAKAWAGLFLPERLSTTAVRA